MPSASVRLVSWNVNGLRAAAKRGFVEWLAATNADVVCVQEVRAHEAQLPEELRYPRGYHAHFVSARQKGYAGVGLYSKLCPKRIETQLGHPEIDAEGRLQFASLGELLVVNGYFPNGNGRERDNSRVPFKLEFYRRLRRRLQPLADRERAVVVLGDFNTAHREIDLARPKQNQQTSGFLPQERRAFERWLAAGWVDSFRALHAGGGHYTWWSQRRGVREKNIGWRIDYVLLSPAAAAHLQAAQIHSEVTGSDHCPISATLDRAVFE